MVFKTSTQKSSHKDQEGNLRPSVSVEVHEG